MTYRWTETLVLGGSVLGAGPQLVARFCKQGLPAPVHVGQPEQDGWTVRTRDGELSAQFEHTIMMTEDGPEVLTLTKDGPVDGHQF